MKKPCSFYLFAAALLGGSLQAQPFFQRFDSIEVKINSNTILNPWAGGLNFAQHSEIDLNMDGIKDLFTFDRTGNKVRTFINRGTPNTVDYKYDASYEDKFPGMREWCLLADYNNDGKEDIFTYSKISGGFDVYLNTSSLSSGLQFQLVAIQQKSVFNPSRFNTSPASIPDGTVNSSWDGTSGSFASRGINVVSLVPSDWHMTSVCMNINHTNDDDLIVYLVNPCGNKIRLVKNAGGSGDNFTKTCFEPIVSNVIGSAGNNTAPFSGSYAPEAGTAAWAAFLACANPNGAWFLNIGDQASGNTGTLTDWAISFHSPTTAFPHGLVNLYVSSVDIPALSDIDNDGDLDVVTFASGGTFLEYHQNMSMEFYGNADSLVYMLKNPCWGNAEEDPLDNDYTLHINCPYTNVSNPGIAQYEADQRSERHAGSCELCLDLDNDGDKEIVVGDVSFSNLTLLTNGGTPKSSNFIAVDTQFPMNTSATLPVDLTLFPCAYYLDVNNDGLKDLIVTPNASGVNTTENFNSEVYYQNTGTAALPVFDYQQSNLLQDNMIEVGEGAYPVFFDYDNDGLKDLLIGNYGYFRQPLFEHKIALFRNTGTSTVPMFELITRDYDGFDGNTTPFSSLGIVNMIPTFGDMDADGDEDMFIGGSDGKVHYFQNIAPAGTMAKFVIAQANFKNSAGRAIDVGDFASPQIFDVDNDGKKDLIIGGRNGKISYFHHSGSPTASVPVLDSITNFFGQVKVNQPGYTLGYSHPFMFREGGFTKILAGSQLGYLRLYDHIDGNLSGAFTLVDSTYLGLREGERTAPSGADINGDGFLDLVVGNYQGGVSFFKGVASLTTSDDLGVENGWQVNIYPNPANNILNIVISNHIRNNYTLELFNTLGQKVFSEVTAATAFSLSTENLKAGVYVCKISELDAAGRKTTASITKRLIIQH
ncbi:MAG TPA: T9SS type A sorting domain-containing protein [Bacteroidia bacterium]|jgi:subtilisin-like proprotein convertase family protein